eukprot:1192573-Prorocentrum_minimum.AAC.2
MFGMRVWCKLGSRGGEEGVKRGSRGGGMRVWCTQAGPYEADLTMRGMDPTDLSVLPPRMLLNAEEDAKVVASSPLLALNFVLGPPAEGTRWISTPPLHPLCTPSAPPLHPLCAPRIPSGILHYLSGYEAYGRLDLIDYSPLHPKVLTPETRALTVIGPEE